MVNLVRLPLLFSFEESKIANSFSHYQKIRVQGVTLMRID